MALDKKAIYKYKMGIDEMARTDIKARIEKTQRRLGVAEFIDAILIPRISDALDRIYALRMYVDDCEDANRRSGLPNNYTAISDHLSCIEDVVRYTYDDGRRYVDGTTTGIEDMAFPEPVEESSVTSLQDISAYVQDAPVEGIVTETNMRVKNMPQSADPKPIDPTEIPDVITIRSPKVKANNDDRREYAEADDCEYAHDSNPSYHVIRKLQISNSLMKKVIKWLLNDVDDTPMIAILLHMLDIPYGLSLRRARCTIIYPRDNKDFVRCLELLNRFPEFQERLPEMAHLSKEWKTLIKHWSEIEDSSEDERDNVINHLLTFDTFPTPTDGFVK